MIRFFLESEVSIFGSLKIYIFCLYVKNTLHYNLDHNLLNNKFLSVVENEKKRIIDLEKEKEEKEKQQKKLQEEKEKSLPSEPAINDPNATSIIFRYPNDDTRKERRFLKTDKISLLYDFVASLGTSMFEENNEFDLITPFPIKVFNDMDKTLEEEKLFPNAVLQIREL